jgi:hypothetical protein
MKRLCGHVAREDVCANFLFQFFDVLKYVKYVFQNKGAYAPKSQNTAKMETKDGH